MLRISSKELREEYRKLLCVPSKEDEQIRRDISRTFPDSRYIRSPQGQQSLFNVLHSVSIAQEETGYVQGINFIAGIILIEAHSGGMEPQRVEEESFAILHTILCEPAYGLCGMFSSSMQQLHCGVHIVDKLLESRSPSLSRHFDENGISPVFFLPSWMLPLFSTKLSLDEATSFFEDYLHDGFPLLIRMSIAALTAHEERLLACDMGQILMELSTSVWASKSARQKILDKLQQVSIDDEEIFTLEMDYATSCGSAQSGAAESGVTWSDLTSSWTLIEKAPVRNDRR
eukprot:g755.t1